MPEELREYRRRQTRRTERKEKYKFSVRKIFRQFIISVIILTFVVFVKFSDTNISNTINEYLKTAFSYKVETDIITDAINNFLNQNAHKGEINNETSVPDI